MAPSRKKVLKKSQKSSKKVSRPKLPSLLDRLPKTELEYLEMLVRMDERNISGNGDSIDQLFTRQRDRTLAKIAVLKAAK
jgi:hypothetical protein